MSFPNGQANSGILARKAINSLLLDRVSGDIVSLVKTSGVQNGSLSLSGKMRFTPIVPEQDLTLAQLVYKVSAVSVAAASGRLVIYDFNPATRRALLPLGYTAEQNWTSGGEKSTALNANTLLTGGKQILIGVWGNDNSLGLWSIPTGDSYGLEQLPSRGATAFSTNDIGQMLQYDVTYAGTGAPPDLTAVAPALTGPSGGSVMMPYFAGKLA